MTAKNTIGVVVGRFQVHELHAGHLFLLDSVAEKHENMLVVLGSPRARLSKSDPLDFETRKTMLLAAYPQANVAELKDCRLDPVWSAKLDELIAREYPECEPILYGSRNSFIPHYSGRNKCAVIQPKNGKICGTKIRERFKKEMIHSSDFRAGQIHQSEARAPLAYQTVDGAIIDFRNKRMLLAAKNGDGGPLRFVGGFVDPEKDKSLELALKREIMEETNYIEVDDLRYIGSHRVDDWRYRGKKDAILTAFFAAQFIFGAPSPRDDIDRLEWVPLEGFTERLVEEHKPLGKMLERHLRERLAQEGGQR